MGDVIPERPSLLKRQLVALGYEDAATLGGVGLDELRHEEVRMREFGLGPLSLPERLSPWTGMLESLRGTGWAGPRTLATMALLTLCIAIGQVVWSGDDAGDRLPETLRIKGPSRVWVYYERAGEVGTYTGHTRLINGDKIRVEILAGNQVHAVLAIGDRQGRLLSSQEDLATASLRLEPGQRATFPGSIELVGADEGERIFVTVCGLEGAGGVPGLQAVFPATGSPIRVDAMPDGCGIEEYKLR